MHAVLQYAEGGSLKRYLQTPPNKFAKDDAAREGMPPPIVAVGTRQLASALGHMHALGMCHRDVKVRGADGSQREDSFPRLRDLQRPGHKYTSSSLTLVLNPSTLFSPRPSSRLTHPHRLSRLTHRLSRLPTCFQPANILLSSDAGWAEDHVSPSTIHLRCFLRAPSPPLLSSSYSGAFGL